MTNNFQEKITENIQEGKKIVDDVMDKIGVRT